MIYQDLENLFIQNILKKICRFSAVLQECIDYYIYLIGPLYKELIKNVLKLDEVVSSELLS